MNQDPDAQPSTVREAIANLLRGLCMGCADVVPGVSGGTVALILGIYERLVTAISNIDGSLVTRLRNRQWRQLAGHIDLLFLLALGMGIGTGVVVMSLVINDLLTNHTTRSLTLAAFFGLILASAVVLAKMIETVTAPQTATCVVLGIVGVMFAYWVSGLHNAGGVAEPGYGYVFVCGGIAICAMILPGISGAMILLVLGIYVHLTEIPHNLLAGEHVGESLLTLVVFGAGCAISLIMFSKFLRWLLNRHHAPTMAVLCGFMIGALRKLWPFQQDLTPEVEKFKHKRFELVWPDSFDSQVAGVLVAGAIAMAVVFIVDRQVRGAKRMHGDR